MEPGRLIFEVILEDKFPKLLLGVGRGGGSRLTCSFGRFGGSAGSSVAPHAGAFMRLFPLEFTDVEDALRAAVVAVEVVEYDASEVVDSREGLRG